MRILNNSFNNSKKSTEHKCTSEPLEPEPEPELQVQTWVQVRRFQNLLSIINNAIHMDNT